jgi:hypothetical protein
MNKRYYRALMIVMLGSMIVSCSKEEGAVNSSPTQVAATSTVAATQLRSVPLDYVSKPGVETSSPVYFPAPPDDPWTWPSYPFTKIPTPTEVYKRETCVFDLSALEYASSYRKIKNGQLTIGFFDENSTNNSAIPMIKLKTSNVDGWNSKWGSLPNVENENPDVLFTKTMFRSVVIVLSKPCIEFGFEMAPNNQGRAYSLTANFGDWIYDNAKGGVSINLTSPEGARLFAVKATKPFTVVHIDYGGSPSDGYPDGVALANIRYKLAK